MPKRIIDKFPIANFLDYFPQCALVTLVVPKKADNHEGHKGSRRKAEYFQQDSTAAEKSGTLIEFPVILGVLCVWAVKKYGPMPITDTDRR